MELNNLATNPIYANVVKEMKEWLKKVHPVPVEGGKAIADTRKKFSD
jgi:hypothetical protein